MSPSTKQAQLGLIAVFILLLTFQTSQAKIFKWQDTTQNRQDLLLLGFGELTMHTLDVSGDVSVFEDANPVLKDGFFANYRLSLFTNGSVTNNFLINGAAIIDSRIGDEYRTIDPSIFRLNMSVETTEPLWDSWRFTGRGVYDPNRQWELSNLDTRLLTQPQDPAKLELLMRLQSEKYGLIEGGSIRPSFKKAKFSLHQRSIFGGYADLHSDDKHIGVEAVGGKLEGKSYREGSTSGSVIGIRADGTTGPFNMVNTPVIVGSEEVKIEVRDRFNETSVLSSETLVRDIDYDVDYLRGRIILHQPVSSETASSNPVFIVITYDFLQDENDYIIGGRAKVKPVDNVQVSGTYLYRDINTQADTTGVAEPEDLMSADVFFDVDDHTTGYVEVAGANNLGVDEDYMALRAGIETEVIDDLKLKADFQKIDDQFRSFTNSDLNPQKNQRRFNLGGNYKLTEKQNIQASFANIRGLEINGQYNPYNGLRDEKIYALGYRNDFIKKFGFGVRLERRKVEDVDNSIHEDNHQDRIMLDADGTFEDVMLLGKFGYKAGYERIMFRDDVDSLDQGDITIVDLNTNQFALTLTSKPNDNANIQFIQRLSLRKRLNDDYCDDRQDVTMASVQVRLHKNLNTLSTYEYKRYTTPGNSVQFWQDDPTRILQAKTFALEYLPLKKIKAVGKFGRHDSRQWLTDTSQTTRDFILGQVTYFHTHHLFFNVESEYTRLASDSLLNKAWDLGLKVNWNKDRFNELTAGLIRRWQLYDNPEIKSTSYIVLLSGSISITKKFFARGSMKSILLDVPLENANSLDDKKTFTKLEVGYDSHSWYRVSVGYERIEGDNDQQPDLNYTGQGVFVRFTGKI